MGRAAGRIVRILLVIVTALGALALTAAAAGPPQWREVESVHISGDDNVINALVATGPRAIWAFGYDLSSIPEWRVLGERWNGHTWTQLNMPDRETEPAEDRLYGAAATGPGNVWAVGYSATAVGNALDRNLIEHWNGKTWTIVDPHLDAGLRHGLSSVAVSRTDVWGVGDITYPDGPDYVPLVYHRSSDSWKSVPFQIQVPGCKSFWRGTLQSVVIDGSAVYAAGWCQFENFSGPNGPQRGFIARWNHGSWTLAYEVPLGDEVNALSVAPNGQVWAAGDTGTPGAQHVYGQLWHGTGTCWTKVRLPHSSNLGGRLDAVAATAAAIYVAGSYARATTGQDYVLSVDPATGESTLEPISPLDTGPVNVEALVAPPGGSPWLGGSHLSSEAAGFQAILARRLP